MQQTYVYDFAPDVGKPHPSASATPRMNSEQYHRKNTCLKQVNAAIGVKPSLKCWMELN